MRMPAKFLGYLQEDGLHHDSEGYKDRVFLVEENPNGAFPWKGWLDLNGGEEAYWLFRDEEIQLLPFDTPLEDFL